MNDTEQHNNHANGIIMMDECRCPSRLDRGIIQQYFPAALYFLARPFLFIRNMWLDMEE